MEHQSCCTDDLLTFCYNGTTADTFNKSQCFPHIPSMFNYARHELFNGRGLLIMIIAVFPFVYAMNFIALEALIRRIKSGAVEYVNQASVVIFYIIFTTVCTYHILMTYWLGPNTVYTCVHYGVIVHYLISNFMVHGMLYGGQFLLLQLCISRLLVYIRRNPNRPSLRSEVRRCVVINLVAYSLGVGIFGLFTTFPLPIIGNTDWVSDDNSWPKTVEDAFCSYHKWQFLQAMVDYVYGNSFCSVRFGNYIKYYVTDTVYGLSSLITTGIIGFIVWTFGARAAYFRSMNTFGRVMSSRLKHERIVMYALIVEGLLALAQSAVTIADDMCWNGAFKADCVSVDHWQYGIVAAEILCALPLFIFVSRRIRRDILSIVLPRSVYRCYRRRQAEIDYRIYDPNNYRSQIIDATSESGQAEGDWRQSEPEEETAPVSLTDPVHHGLHGLSQGEQEEGNGDLNDTDSSDCYYDEVNAVGRWRSCWRF